MEQLVALFVARFRPRTGWWRALSGVSAALIVALAAGVNVLKPPVSPFAWAGLCGCLLGLRLAPARETRCARWNVALATGVCLLGVALLALAIGQALPPMALGGQDLVALARWISRMWQASTVTAPLPGIAFPASSTAGFFAEALPRFWRELATAPQRGEAGARLLVATGGSVLTWLGALTLGWGLQRGRWLLLWELPLFTALLSVTLFGGGGMWLAIGIALLVLLVIGDMYRQAAARWDARGTDYSPELQRDSFAWGGGLLMIVLVVALVLPAWLGNPVAALIWGRVEPPSGLAALEAPAPPVQRAPPSAQIGLSTLPALTLGVSLEQAPSDQVSLRVTVAAPLPESTMPHYWRARVYNLYTGGGWSTNARVRDEAPLVLRDASPAGLIVQQIEDTRPVPALLIGVADIVGVDVTARAERLADGSLMALAAQPGLRHYQVVSYLQEDALPPAADTAPHDMRPFLGLPALPPRVGETAHALTSGAVNDTARALALEAYLRSLPYSYQVAPLPAAGDAVDQFLFDMRQGYCTYYASAMAVMARTLGIPARVASGYATGDYDPASHSYTLYERLAHAWPELYIDGRWVAFEPTPVRPLPVRDHGRPQPATPQPAAPAPSLAGPLTWLLVLALLVLLAALGLRRPRAALGPALLAQAEIEALGRHIGVAWPPGATLHEYAALLAQRIDAGTPLHLLVDLIARSRYGDRPLDADDERQLDRAWRDLRARAREQRSR